MREAEKDAFDRRFCDVSPRRKLERDEKAAVMVLASVLLFAFSVVLLVVSVVVLAVAL